MPTPVPERGQYFLDREGRRWVVDGVVLLRMTGRTGHYIVSLKGAGLQDGELVLSSADFASLLQSGALQPVLH